MCGEDNLHPWTCGFPRGLVITARKTNILQASKSFLKNGSFFGGDVKLIFEKKFFLQGG